ncbi:MAG: hypothetical protein C4529_10985 [Deltaproteobacteria bacterium]|nr:MAG: hypothetical protein C4529_10985 [Deltaproteobacteria bacterium]
MGGAHMKMLSGFNHNIKFRGKVYHVQTEDGGKENPKVITHVFHGGVILDSVRQAYDDILGQPQWQSTLKERMKAQHLEEIRRVLAGDIAAPDEEPGER